MLCLALKPGEYLTIGEKVVLQYDRTTGERCRLKVDAPREIAVVRGTVRERNGEARPACVAENEEKQIVWHKNSVAWNRSKEQALQAMRKTLREMDGREPAVRTLRRQLDHLFPPTEEVESVESAE